MYAELMQKRCSKCEKTKDKSEFYFIKKLKSYRSRCRVCTNEDHNLYMKTEKGIESRNKANSKKNWKSSSQIVYKSHWSRFKKYGITDVEFKSLLNKQNNRCSICGILDYDTGKSLCVDHCHTTGNIRELLCNKCNSAIGMVKESIDIIDRLREYLVKHKK